MRLSLASTADLPRLFLPTHAGTARRDGHHQGQRHTHSPALPLPPPPALTLRCPRRPCAEIAPPVQMDAQMRVLDLVARRNQERADAAAEPPEPEPVQHHPHRSAAPRRTPGPSSRPRPTRRDTGIAAPAHSRVIEYEDLEFLEPIGRGAFGVVYKYARDARRGSGGGGGGGGGGSDCAPDPRPPTPTLTARLESAVRAAVGDGWRRATAANGTACGSRSKSS